MMFYCHSLSKVIGRKTILDNVSFEIKSGEKIAILGASGSGKTTLLRLIAGLDAPSSGEVSFNAEEIYSQRATRPKIKMVFQKISIYPHMTVEENLTFPLLSRGTTKNRANARAEEVASLLRIKHLLSQRGASLSGGEAQRVAIGKAIADPPDLLLLDEPFSNLDQTLRWALLDEIKSLHTSLGLTSILVTHNCEEALYFADRVMIIGGGKILQLSTSREILENPSMLDVAELVFKPTPNIISGRINKITPGTGSWVSHDETIHIGVSGDLFKDANPPEDASIVWMPQLGFLRKSGEGIGWLDDQIIIQGVVVDKAYYDGQMLITFRSGEFSLKVVSAMTDFSSLGDGRAQILVPLERILFFDSTSRRRLNISPVKSLAASNM
jgi:multiple sugar transport system ATP-binding protein